MLPQWDIDQSVFEPRRHECDAKSFWRTKRIIARMFETDWAQMSEKSRFSQMVSGLQGLYSMAQLSV